MLKRQISVTDNVGKIGKMRRAAGLTSVATETSTQVAFCS